MFRGFRLGRLLDDPTIAHKVTIYGIILGTIIAALIVFYIIWTIRDHRRGID